MPPRTTRNTRSKGAASTAGAGSTAPAASSKYTLDAESDNPPRLFVLPTKATADARIVTLPHPRYAAKPTRYLVCPETGVYEFTQIASPKTAPRSWLITSDKGEAAVPAEETTEETTEEATEKTPTEEKTQDESTPDFAPHTTQDADLFVATAVDPLFLVLPALAADPASSSGSASPSSRPRGGGKRMFLTADDHFDALSQDGGSHLAELLRHQPSVRALFTARMAAVCDTVAAGDEAMLRLNEDKLLLALLAKAQRTSGHLPASLAGKFVAKALEAPVLSVRSAATGAVAGSVSGAATPVSTAESFDSGAESQSTVVSATASFASEASTASTAATSVAADAAGDDVVRAAMQAPDEVAALQRLRVAFQFICSRYVPPAVAAALHAKLRAGGGGVDFAPLDAYLAKLAALRQEAALARSAAMDYAGGRKHGLGDDEDGDDRAEKRRKQQEDEKRKKAGESRGVRDLKKVNVSGMKKLSAFFKKV